MYVFDINNHFRELYQIIQVGEGVGQPKEILTSIIKIYISLIVNGADNFWESKCRYLFGRGGGGDSG